MVEEILEISPAYNADKDNKKKRKKKKIEEPISEDVREHESHMNEGEHLIQSLPPNDSPPEFPGMNKKQTSYIENLNGLDPTYYNRHMS